MINLQAGPRLADRFGFINRTAERTKTPILASAPSTSNPDDSTVVLRLYDVIDSWGGPWGTSASEFAEALDGLDRATSEIRLHINSPGGEVFEGLAILNQLRSHPARVVAHVDGLAASIASVIAAGADELVMGGNTELMIHDALGLCVGNAADMRDLAGQLDRVSDNIASVYAEKAGGDRADWRTAMLAETWYSAAEAVDAGLADRVDGQNEDSQPSDAFDLSTFRYAGRAAAPRPTARENTEEVDPTLEPPEAPAARISNRDRVRHRMNALQK